MQISPPETEWIAVAGGYRAAVDAEDYARVVGASWCLLNGYVGRRIAVAGNVWAHEYLQQVVLRLPPGQDRGTTAITFENGDRFDCRKRNLSVECKAAQLQRKRPMRNRAGFLGVVTLSDAGDRFVAKVTVRGRAIKSRTFATAEDAARARDELARIHLPGSLMNFPRAGESGVERAKRPTSRIHQL